MLMVKHRGASRSQQLCEAIEEDIVYGRLTPGSRLDETQLGGRFGVSRTPIREALLQLASSGLVEIRPRRGTVVAEVGPQRLYEMFETMAELEAACARLASRSEEHTSELQSRLHLVCRLLLEKKKKKKREYS